MLSWIKEHPYLTGALTLGLIVLYFVWRNVSSAPSPVVSSGYVPSDAVQQASIAAGVAQKQSNDAIVAQNNQLQAQLAALQLHEGTSLQIAQLESQVALQNTLTSGQVATQQSSDQLAAALAAVGAQVTISEGNNQTAVALAGIQAPLTAEQIQASLDALKDTNATSLQLAQINTSADIAKTQILTTGQVQIAGGMDAVQAAQIQASVNIAGGADAVAAAQAAASVQIAGGQDAVDAAKYADLAAIYEQYIKTSGDVTMGQQKINASLVPLIQSGVFNKGGAGGSNQVAVAASVTGQPGVGVAAAASAPGVAAAQSTTPIWTSLINGFFGAAGKIGTAAVSPA